MAHDNAHDHGHGAGGESHGSVKSYLIGFVLAVILTVIPFWVVMSGDFSRTVSGVAIAVTAVLQMLVHLVFFLHLDRSSESRWNVNAAVFTVVVIGIIVAGTLWVMHNMNVHMMH
ncbi:cytochrome o ubiquinol oxidase subunit IV [Stenotrophomonas sp. SORGH_AS_0321]|uniref:cytochrome o ubiquinol oxidase subunit IV n=1 Tax=Stenotrophomonas sp. SORGH_AS_0321 TaxID=3041787 RepID=UPI0028648914|nr:cytochrome o ubiquinol oxidase subunit IV [Stenotrophomonas sp. SORGH_AS_0321]MDR6093722.1 cytochrome o ubiquinol oxidase operon protein cyoD [Stenotrophomonas sp. SORGH_AS_0321]